MDINAMNHMGLYHAPAAVLVGPTRVNNPLCLQDFNITFDGTASNT